mgnify:CR=1 FL=1
MTSARVPAAVVPIATIHSYHAHVYYDPATRPLAEALRAAVGARFAVRLGRWHDQPVGPHPVSMYQIAFAVPVFPALVPWLMLNRAGLAILVHPNTGYPRADHAHHPLWMGRVLDLDLQRLPEQDEALAEEAVNTAPTLAP